MSKFAPYIPIDRYRTLLDGTGLPESAYGATLFADISGFTPLTEKLTNLLGPRRGAEELTHHLNMIYAALVNEVHRYRGSVIYFSGDAITCWFEQLPDNEATHRAVTAAWQMQKALQEVGEVPTGEGDSVRLSMKIAVSAGLTRRFVVGDPQVQYLDVIAGSALDRLAEAEHLAGRGEIVLAAEVVSATGDLLDLSEWRSSSSDADPAHAFAVLAGLRQPARPVPWEVSQAVPTEDTSQSELDSQLSQPWILAPVFERLKAGLSDYLTELRPAVAVFIHFDGIDYDRDPQASHKLDQYIRWIQSILSSYEGNLMDITIGDKGSYLYAAFGAPQAHQDDIERAVRAAFAIANNVPAALAWLTNVQVGLSSGVMRTGIVGSPSRHIYGVQGDEVNLAARLMSAAQPGQVLVSSPVYEAVAALFEWQALPPLRVKGKAQPITAYRLTGLQKAQDYVLQTLVQTALPLVGREAEMALIQQKMALVRQGQGQIVALTGEAGMGKSRLVSEVLRRATEEKLQIYFGECQSYGTNNSYLVWHSIWRNFFHVAQDENQSPDRLKGQVEAELNSIEPSLVPRAPLLRAVLNLPLPDNDLTQAMDAKLRKASLESLLVDCIRLRSRKQSQPTLLVLEDCQWLDPLSHDLLVNIGRVIEDCPVLIIVAYRSPQTEHSEPPRVVALPICTVLTVKSMEETEAARFVTLKMRQLGLTQELPSAFVDAVSSRTQNNPFFIVELLNYLHDQELNLADLQNLARLELPTSLHSLILSRVDRLAESPKVVLKIASIIGRVFRLLWLSRLLPIPHATRPEAVRHDLDVLNTSELTQPEQPEPDASYVFSHIIIWEVVYQNLAFATRAELHWQLGRFIEEYYADNLDQYIDLLAYNFSLTNDQARQRQYLLKAGETAQADFSNSAAADYYNRLLPLLPENEQITVKLKLGQVLEQLSQWNEAENLYQESLTLAEKYSDKAAQARIQNAISKFYLKQKRYAQAEPLLLQSLATFKELGDLGGQSQVLTDLGEVYRLQGNYGQARLYYNTSLDAVERVDDPGQHEAIRAATLKAAGTASSQQGDSEVARSLYQESLDILKGLKDKPGIASVLNNLGVVARHQGDYELSRKLTEESLGQFRELGDRWAMGVLLNNLGLLARDQGDYSSAQNFLEEGLVIRQQLGDKWGVANVLSSLGNVLIDKENYGEAREVLEQSLTISQELGNQNAIAYVLEYLAAVEAAQSQPSRAAFLAGAAAAIRRQLGIPLSQGEQAWLDQRLTPARHSLADDRFESFWRQGEQTPLDGAIALAFQPGVLP